MHAGDVAQEDENDGNLGSYTITTTEADMGTNDVVNAQGTADSHRLWCVVRDESLKVGQFDAWDLDRYLRQYWKRHLKVRNAISSLRESKIIVGKELSIPTLVHFMDQRHIPIWLVRNRWHLSN